MMTRQRSGRRPGSRSRLAALLLAAGCLLAAAPLPDDGPIAVRVDLRDAPRKLFHAHLVLPVQPGPLTLLYPKYIPGEHGPTGPIMHVAGLHFRAGSRDLPWQRDLADMFTFHLDVPAGTARLEVDLDFLSPVGGQFTGGGSATPDLAALNWNQMLLYPAGARSADVVCKPSLLLPEGWKYATALTTSTRDGQRVQFAPVSLETLVDSPVIAGRHLREIDISVGSGPRHFLDMVSDDPAAMQPSATDVRNLRQLVAEATAMFGAPHYEAYHFLLTLSDQTAHFGLEHHQSSDDRTGQRLFQDPEHLLVGSGLLPHEFVHSWNGKFRRPADLATPDFQQPMLTDLLWVYEGLTTYLGEVLTARSGLRTAQQFRDGLALTAAQMDHQRGRSWRPLSDTTAAAQVLYQSPRAWETWRRRTDFYPEGELIWLDVDTTIRRLSDDTLSLDDFTRRFHGTHPGRVEVLPYSFDDLVAALGQVVDYDWADFLRERLDTRQAGAPLGGLAGGGWRLVYDDVANPYLAAVESTRHSTDQLFSVGIRVGGEGEITDVLWDGPAFAAGIGAGMTLVAVQGRAYDPDVLGEAVAAGADDSSPLELLVENQGFFRTYTVDYHGGLRYPHLERIESTPDMLSEIIAPHADPVR